MKLFAPTSRTIGGPGNYKGPCGKTFEIFKSNFEKRILCVTVENMGKCDLDVELRIYNLYSPGSSSGSTSIYGLIPGGASKTMVGRSRSTGTKDPVWFSHGNIYVTCKASKTNPDADTCRYRWRVDLSKLET